DPVDGAPSAGMSASTCPVALRLVVSLSKTTTSPLTKLRSCHTLAGTPAAPVYVALLPRYFNVAPVPYIVCVLSPKSGDAACPGLGVEGGAVLRTPPSAS